MPSAATPLVASRWRIPLLVLAVLVIVVAPFLLLRMAEERNRDAETMVAHTLQVEAALQIVSAAVRNIEAVTLERLLGADAPILEERMDYSLTVIKPTLDTIEELTRDSAE